MSQPLEDHQDSIERKSHPVGDHIDSIGSSLDRVAQLKRGIGSRTVCLKITRRTNSKSSS
jgi:hypothetical protein